MISDPLPATLGRFKEGFDLTWIEKIFRSMWISRTLNIIRGGEVEHSCDFLRSLVDCGAQLSTKNSKVKWAQRQSIALASVISSALRHSRRASAALVSSAGSNTSGRIPEACRWALTAFLPCQVSSHRH
jgi:hypothetical protein